jgi:hypothetical protein
MKFYHQLFNALTLFFLIGCSNPGVEDVNWITGTWKSSLKDGIQLEKWVQEQDSLVGQRFLVLGKDTTLMQNMHIYKGESILEMRITPTGAPYSTLLECQVAKENQVIFQNVQQSFPELLEYAIVRDTLAIYARGRTQGMMNEAVFAFTRVEPH